jgi:acetoin utilization deacetylase AcuC-like enzyme
MKSIPVFFTPKMVADSGSFSPSAAKPLQVVESWQRQFPITIVEPTPVTVDDIARAHDRQWVKDVLAGVKENGFGNKSPAVAATLPYTSGAMLSAAREALASGKVAAAPCSGFHHAEFRTAQGFCTFNGLMVTALSLKEDGVERVGILDLDMHYGNGTDDILNVHKATVTPNNPDGWVRHATAGALFLNADQAAHFFAMWLPHVLDAMKDCDIVLFQAGADPHVSDPYGGWLTTPQLRERDAMVFDALAKHKVPVAWNLAGGYQIEKDGSIPKVLEIHDNTMRECVRVFGTTSSASSPRTSTG